MNDLQHFEKNGKLKTHEKKKKKPNHEMEDK
jgi:hypothetical protein